MARLFIVDEQGASAPSVSDARERFDEANIEAFGASLDTTTHAPQNQIAGINALVWTEVGEDLLRAALWGASPSYARGVYLDSLGGLLDIRREQATRTRVNAVLTGSAGTIVPAGSLARTDAGDQFELETPVTLQSGGSDGVFVAVNDGPIECDAGDLSNVVSVLSGWTGVNNDRAGSLGRYTESDASYRVNILARTAQSSVGSIGALRSAARAAGASSVKVLENTETGNVSSGGVSLPGHSILVLAEGGLADDVARAVENHRGMGVGTYSAITGASTALPDVQTISNGRLRWNGSDVVGFNFATDTLSEVATELTSLVPGVVFVANDGRLLAFYSWTPETTGFEDIGGNVAESVDITAPFRVTGVEYYTSSNTTSLRVRYSSSIRGFGQSGTPEITYTQNGSTQTLNTTGSSVSFAGSNMMWWTLSNPMPSDASDVKVVLKNSVTADSGEVASTTASIAATEETIVSSGAPNTPYVFGEPSTTSVRVWGWAIGDVSKWQYRRFQNSDYIDNDWVDIGGSNSQRLGSGGTGINIQGFTANLMGSRVDLRAVNGSNGSSKAASIVFDTTNAEPAPISSTIDGRSIVLTFDRPLLPNQTTSVGHWSISKNGVNATEQWVRGRRVYIKTNTPVLSTDSSLTLSYTRPAANTGRRVESLSRVGATNFSNRALTNLTRSGVPGAPNPLTLFEDGDGYRFTWEPNDGGGQSVDRYEYQISRDNGNTWSDWVNIASTLSTLSPDGDLPDIVRVRASTPNVRSAEVLGLAGLELTPFMRPVQKALTITMVIGVGSSLTGNDLEAIRVALLSRVLEYETGATLRVADLRSEVERLPGVDIDSFSVTSGGSAVDGVAQNSYIRWSLSRSDITISFA